jgi:hypothetical protein
MANSSGLTRKIVRIAVFSLTVLALIGLIGAAALHSYGKHRLEDARADFESAWGHLTPIDAPPEPPENENGARWLTAGGYAIVWSIDDQMFIGDLSGRTAREWTDTEISRARWILNEQQNALALLNRAGSFEAFHLGTNGKVTTHNQIPVLDIVKGLRLLTVEARLAWKDGRRKDSLESLNTVSRSADGLLKTRVVMGSITGSAAARWFCGSAADLIGDPCADGASLSVLDSILPKEDPTYWTNVTLATQIDEIANEGLDYTADLHDPSLGWSIPFWVSSRFLFEDLIMAEILARWNRHIDLCQGPAALWPAGAGQEIWGDAAWPPWKAMAGVITPNLLSSRARSQAASTELQQLRIALELRLAEPAGLGPDACAMMSDLQPTALTGKPVSCRYDPDLNTIVIDVPGAEEALADHVSARNSAARISPIVMALGKTAELRR